MSDDEETTCHRKARNGVSWIQYLVAFEIAFNFDNFAHGTSASLWKSALKKFKFIKISMFQDAQQTKASAWWEVVRSSGSHSRETDRQTESTSSRGVNGVSTCQVPICMPVIRCLMENEIFFDNRCAQCGRSLGWSLGDRKFRSRNALISDWWQNDFEQLNKSDVQSVLLSSNRYRCLSRSLAAIRCAL